MDQTADFYKIDQLIITLCEFIAEANAIHHEPHGTHAMWLNTSRSHMARSGKLITVTSGLALRLE